MLNRNVFLCATCKNEFVLAYNVGLNARDRIAFPCPRCNAVLRCTYVKMYEPPSLDVETLDFKWTSIVASANDSMPGLTIATDIPVHTSFRGQGFKLGGSLWLSIYNDSDHEYLSKAANNWNLLNGLVLEHLPSLRRAASCWRSGDSNNLRLCLNGLKGCNGKDDFSLIATGLQQMMDLCFVEPTRHVVDREVMQLLNRLSKKADYTALLTLLASEDIMSHIDRLVDLAKEP